MKVGKIRGILLAFALVALCGCSSRPSQLWSFAMPEQTVLVSNTGKVVWQGNGEAVRNPWGNFVVTDWTPAEPVQIVVSSEGKILVEGQPGQQLMRCARWTRTALFTNVPLSRTASRIKRSCRCWSDKTGEVRGGACKIAGSISKFNLRR